MFGRGRRIGGGETDNSWPGFVDALSTLLLVIIFLLSMFVLAQFFLGQALTGKDQAIAELRSELSELGDLLKMERTANNDLRDRVGSLSSQLGDMTADRDTIKGHLASASDALAIADARVRALETEHAETASELEDITSRFDNASKDLADERDLSAAARAQVIQLRRDLAAVQSQLSRLEAALDASEDRDRRNQAVIVDLGRRLNGALASKVEELAGYRSEFFGRLKEVLQNRNDVRVEGDRFVFASELLFASASADLNASGKAELRRFAESLIVISAEIPAELDWILRVDGHTDNRPITNAPFPSNWELSAARAISVVKFLTEVGVPPQRLAATGFGEYQPIDPANNSFAWSRNRRIEMRLTQR